MFGLFNRKKQDSHWIVLPMHSSVPGKIPTLAQLPVTEMVAVNRADNIIYRNVNGVIKRYKEVK